MIYQIRGIVNTPFGCPELCIIIPDVRDCSCDYRKRGMLSIPGLRLARRGATLTDGMRHLPCGQAVNCNAC